MELREEVELKVYQIRNSLEESVLEARTPIMLSEDPTYNPEKDAETIYRFLNQLPYRTVEKLKEKIMMEKKEGIHPHIISSLDTSF